MNRFAGAFVLRPTLVSLCVLSLALGSLPAAGAAFTPGNLVVYRVGSGTGSLANTGNPVFLDEYTTAGGLPPVQSIALPTTVSGANKQLVASGTATSEGLLTRSTNGIYLVMAGYAANIPYASNLGNTASTTVPRTIGRVDYAGNYDTTMALTDLASGNSPRSVVTTDGAGVWATGGGGGVRYAPFGSTTSTQLSTTATNLRGAGIFDGQLYISAQTGAIRLATVGNGLPTNSGQTITNLTGLPTATGSPYGFFFADLDGVAGVDTVYVADDGVAGGTSANQILKYCLVTGSWVARGSVALTAARGLTGVVTGTSVTLYATNGTNISTVTDTSGYPNTMTGAVTSIATAGANTAFRGIAFAPVAPLPDLAVSVTGPVSAGVGAAFDYTITASNNGTANASNVTVQMTLPAGVTYSTASGPGFIVSQAAGVVTFSGGTINAGSSATLTVTVSAPAATTVTLPVGAVVIDPSNAISESNESNNSSTAAVVTVVADLPDLRVSVTGPANAVSGVPFAYTLTVANTGTQPASPVTVTLTLPVGPTYVGATVSNGFTASYAAPVVTFSGGTIAAGASATLGVSVTATANVTLPVGAAVADPGNTIPEISESNNASTTAVTTAIVTTSARIHAIQGASHTSPMNGQAVTAVPGIVTSVRSTGAMGFYMQDPSPDGIDATSEGIIVYTGTDPSASVAVGDEVYVNGTVLEFRPGGASSNNVTTTEIAGNPTWIVLSHGNVINPTVIGVGGRIPPPTDIEDDCATGDIETSNTFDPADDGMDFWESLEGMLVQVNDAVVVGSTYRSGTPQNGAFVVLPDNGANASLRTPRGGIVLQSTDFNPERVWVTDVSANVPDVVVGDRFNAPGTRIVGILEYLSGTYMVKISQPLPAFTPANLPAESTSIASTPARLTVATFNVSNLNPGDPQAKFDGLAARVVSNLGSPAILTVEEVQDNSGPSNDGTVAADVTLNALITAITNAGGPTYQYRQINPENNKDGGQGGGNIRQVFLFDPLRVTFVDRPGAIFNTPNAVLTDASGPYLQFSPGRIDPTNPAFTDYLNGPATSNCRKPLAGEFLFNGQRVFVIANHLPGKGPDDGMWGRHQPAQLITEPQRTLQAGIINGFLSQILAADATSNVVVLGDLNDFQFSGPLSTLKGSSLVNLIDDLPVAEQYTYIFDGNSQAIDHILVSNHPHAGALVDVVHINADYLIATRLSDHDPVVASLAIGPATVTATAGTPQTANVGTAFATALAATVADAAGNPVPNVTVTFTAPASGASGTFAATGTATQTATTNASGVATASTFTANGTTGSYGVTASVTGVATPATFSLSNVCPGIVGTVGGTTAICAGSSTNVTVTVAGGIGPYTVTLTNGGGTQTGAGPVFTFSVSPASTTTYAVASLTDTYGCPGSGSGSATVTVNPLPTPTIAGPDTVCSGQSVILDAGAGYSSYSWAPGGQTTQTITVSPAATTTYTVTVTTAAGCGASASKLVTVLPVVGPASLSAPATLCQGAVATATTTASGASLSYLWSVTNFEGFVELQGAATGSSVSFRGLAPGRVTIELAVTPAGGCTTILTADVDVLPAPATPVVSAPTSVKTGETGLAASVAEHAGSTYAWSITNGTITGGQGTAAITFTAGDLGEARLEVLETSAAGCLSGTGAAVVTVVGASGPCVADGTTLCLNKDRFKVTVVYADPATAEGRAGQAISFQPVPNDSGWFWFFEPTNMELLVKVLDGRGVNGKFWVLYGALTDLEYTVTILDTVTGATKEYTSQRGTMASAADIEAFEDVLAAAAPLPGLHTAVKDGLKSGDPISVGAFFAAQRAEVPARAAATAAAPAACTPDATTLCLNNNRFQARLHWQVELPIGTDGPGVSVPVTADTGCFWFFEPKNIELALKVLDGTGVNGFYWVLYGALTDVEYILEVTDTQTGTVRTFAGQQGIMASKAFTEAFPAN